MDSRSEADEDITPFISYCYALVYFEFRCFLLFETLVLHRLY